MMQRTVIGAHHKTGSMLSSKIVDLLVEFIPGRPADAVALAELPNWMRKLPLSEALKRNRRALFARNMWFEHEVDVAGFKFLHFVRHPAPRIASAYLYHKRGAPSDLIKWADWRIFDFDGRKSYAEVLNALDLHDGLIVEALRTYPEALGSTRAHASAARLPAEQRLAVWLDRFVDGPAASLSAIFEFIYGNSDDRLGDFLARAETRGIVLEQDPAAPRNDHVTRNDAGRAAVEEAIAGSAEITRLYGDLAQRMEAPAGPGEVTRPASTNRTEVADIVEDIERTRNLLLLSPDNIQSSERFWTDPDVSSMWQTFPLSNFGNGHLMMQPFIQKFLSRIA